MLTWVSGQTNRFDSQPGDKAVLPNTGRQHSWYLLGPVLFFSS